MKISMILNVVLAIALVFLSYKLALAGNGNVNEQDSSEVVINNILKRTSVRSYKDRAVESEKVEKLLRAGMAAKAPLAIVVCGDMDKALEGDAREFWIQDCSAATENILLAATGMGLGAVWTGTYPSKERCAAVADVLQLPETLIPLNTIVIGYPDTEPTPKDKWKKENVSYNVYGEE